MAKNTPKNTLVTFLLDRTGSMRSIKQATMEAFNAYLDGLRKEKNIRFSLVQFDAVSIDKTCVGVPAKDAPELTDKNYEPRGSTPLIDAAYKTIKAVEKSVEAEPKTQIVICIQTDGEENCSREYTWAQLNDLIKEKIKAGWQFNFMGAGINAYAQGTKMGFAVADTMSYDSSNREATMSAFQGRASATRMYASGVASNMNIGRMEKLAAGDKFDPSVQLQVTVKPVAKPKTSPIVDDFSLTNDKK